MLAQHQQFPPLCRLSLQLSLLLLPLLLVVGRPQHP
jgi:hypothetical protein